MHNEAKPLTLAIDRYDRHFPFFDSTLTLPADLNLKVLQVGEHYPLRDGGRRHSRMLRNSEFDIAELSLSSYVMSKARGMDVTAVPVFPRRLFSQNQMFVNAATGISDPRELAGRRVALQSFQTTLAVLAKGDLATEYGVPLDQVTWVVRQDEVIPFDMPPNLTTEAIPADANLGELLSSGEVDALFYSRVPVCRAPETIRRLFADPAAACGRYFEKRGYFPIMHVLAMSKEAVAAKPELPRLLLSLYEQAKVLVDGYRADPGWSLLPLDTLANEDYRSTFKGDPWPVGLKANRQNLTDFIAYSYAQGLIDREMRVEDLFDPSVLDT